MNENNDKRTTRAKAKSIIPILLFAILVLSLPHGLFETLAFVGLLITAVITLWKKCK